MRTHCQKGSSGPGKALEAASLLWKVNGAVLPDAIYLTFTLKSSVMDKNALKRHQYCHPTLLTSLMH